MIPYFFDGYNIGTTFDQDLGMEHRKEEFLELPQSVKYFRDGAGDEIDVFGLLSHQVFRFNPPFFTHLRI